MHNLCTYSSNHRIRRQCDNSTSKEKVLTLQLYTYVLELEINLQNPLQVGLSVPMLVYSDVLPSSPFNLDDYA